jgi:hypothetical protein
MGLGDQRSRHALQPLDALLASEGEQQVALALDLLVAAGRQVRLAGEPQSLQAGVEGVVVEAAAAVVTEHRLRLGGPGRGVGHVRWMGRLGESGSGEPQEEGEAAGAGDQPCGPVRAT